jgi:ABC-2 type transport system permease protein
MTESQVVAAVVSFAVAFIIWLGSSVLNYVGSSLLSAVASSINMLSRYQSFADGVVGFAPVVYYISVSGLFIFLTVRAIERRRWTGV